MLAVDLQWNNLASSSGSKCVLTVNGGVRCFGENDANGVLGYHDTTDRYDASVIVDVNLGSDKIIQLDVGHAHSCALTNKGQVRCWGDGKDGALGRDNEHDVGDNEHPSIGNVVAVGWTVAQVSAGLDYSCVMSLDGKGRCWGVMALGSLVRITLIILAMAQVQR